MRGEIAMSDHINWKPVPRSEHVVGSSSDKKRLIVRAIAVFAKDGEVTRR